MSNTVSSDSISKVTETSKEPGASSSAFCDTHAIVRRMLPPSFAADEKAIALIEKCVGEFASSVTSIAGGYSIIDYGSLLSSMRAGKPTEVKSEHILRTVENMGFVDFVKPLTIYKQVLKDRLPASSVARPPPAAAPAKSSSSTATAADKKRIDPADGPPLKTAKMVGVPGGGMTALSRPMQGSSSSSGAKSASTGPSRPTVAGFGTQVHPAQQVKPAISQREARDRLVRSIDDDLLSGSPPATERELSEKYRVSLQQVRNRVAALRAKQFLLRGLAGPMGSVVPVVGGHTSPATVSAPAAMSTQAVPMKATGAAPSAQAVSYAAPAHAAVRAPPHASVSTTAGAAVRPAPAPASHVRNVGSSAFLAGVQDALNADRAAQAASAASAGGSTGTTGSRSSGAGV